MRHASEPIRRRCLESLLGAVLAVTALPAAASVARTAARHPHHKPALAKHVAYARGRSTRSQTPVRPSIVLITARIPIWRFDQTLAQFPPPAVPPQNEQRLPRQASAKTAALQGVVSDPSARGIIGAVI